MPKAAKVGAIVAAQRSRLRWTAFRRRVPRHRRAGSRSSIARRGTYSPADPAPPGAPVAVERGWPRPGRRCGASFFLDRRRGRAHPDAASRSGSPGSSGSSRQSLPSPIRVKIPRDRRERHPERLGDLRGRHPPVGATRRSPRTTSLIGPATANRPRLLSSDRTDPCSPSAADITAQPLRNRAQRSRPAALGRRRERPTIAL